MSGVNACERRRGFESQRIDRANDERVCYQEDVGRHLRIAECGFRCFGLFFCAYDFSVGNPGLVCVCELSLRLVALTADDCVCVGVCKWTCLLLDVCVCVCHSVSGLEASLAHHVVRLCWAAKSDCRFHQRQMIIQPLTQKSAFLTLPFFSCVSLWPQNPIAL